MNNTPPLLIGFDIGTTSLKGAVFTAWGDVQAAFSEPYPRQTPQPGWVEQDPNVWMRLLSKAILHFSSAVDLADIDAVCVCSQVNTHIFADQDGVALGPAIVWQDTRARELAAQLDASFSPEEKIAVWGGDFVVDSSFALTRAAWMAKYHPDVWERTRYIFSPKDYCNFALTGVAATDPFSSVGLVGQGGAYLTQLDSRLTGFMDRLPPLRDMRSPIGTVRIRDYPQFTPKACTGTMDAWANFIGSGVVRSGEAALIAGTSSIVGVMSDKAIPTRGIISFPPFEGRVIHAGPTQSGSDAFSWFAHLSNNQVGELLQSVRGCQISRDSPIFLPHLQGERAPIWDPNARGTFVGLNSTHDLRDVALAVMEGVAFSERQLFAECCHAAGYVPATLRLSGGSSIDAGWTQLRADVLGIEVTRQNFKDSGVLGAAIIAGVGSSLFRSVAEGADALVLARDTFRPDPDRRSTSHARYGLYRSIYRQLKPVFDEHATFSAHGLPES